MLLRGDKDTTFLSGANIVPEGVKYVMTLDADTRLMRDAVTKLVGKMHTRSNRRRSIRYRAVSSKVTACCSRASHRRSQQARTRPSFSVSSRLQPWYRSLRLHGF